MKGQDNIEAIRMVIDEAEGKFTALDLKPSVLDLLSTTGAEEENQVSVAINNYLRRASIKGLLRKVKHGVYTKDKVVKEAETTPTAAVTPLTLKGIPITRFIELTNEYLAGLTIDPTQVYKYQEKISCLIEQVNKLKKRHHEDMEAIKVRYKKEIELREAAEEKLRTIESLFGKKGG